MKFDFLYFSNKGILTKMTENVYTKVNILVTKKQVLKSLCEFSFFSQYAAISEISIKNS